MADYYADPEVGCDICDGTGWLPTERPDGAPQAWVQCYYCHGQGNATWVVKRREAKYRFWDHKYLAMLIVATAVAFAAPALHPRMAPGDQNNGVTLALVLAWAALAAAWVVWYLKRSKYVAPAPDGVPPRPPRKHAPGFTDDREIAYLAALAAGITAKGAWDHRHQPGGPAGGRK